MSSLQISNLVHNVANARNTGTGAIDHERDGKLKPGVPSNDTPNGKTAQQETLTFNMVRVCNLSDHNVSIPNIVGLPG